MQKLELIMTFYLTEIKYISSPDLLPKKVSVQVSSLIGYSLNSMINATMNDDTLSEEAQSHQVNERVAAIFGSMKASATDQLYFLKQLYTVLEVLKNKD